MAICVNFEQVECPAALKDKSGCSRNDEHLQLASGLFNSSSARPAPPGKSGLDTGSKIAIAACIPLLAITSILVAYWLLKRRRKLTNKTLKTDNVSSESVPGSNQPELAGRSENTDPGTQELSPIYIQEAEITNVHELGTVLGHELRTNATRKKAYEGKRRKIINYKKPLPKLPSELIGSPVCQELEGDFKGQ
ncbi:MAG: hypothetical protein Q9225_000152 [Loekoesia sp. 1 TL-2023]